LNRPVPSQLVLQRLAVPAPDDDGARLPLYWRGPAELAQGGGALVVPRGGTADLGTWQNAAPVGWWAGLGLETVRLEVRGAGDLTVHASRGGQRRILGRATLHAGQPWALEVDTRDVDWCWLDLAASPEPGALDQVEWIAPRAAEPRPLTVVVPTFRAEDDALAQLARLTSPALTGVVGHVVLVDQGGTLASHAGAAAALAAAGDRVLHVDQPNLGGSGGYSRGLLEAGQRWPDDPVFLHDDDARAHPETLRRLTVYAALAPRTFFATGLLDADAPTRLQALAEGVARRPFRWGPTDGIREGEPVDVGTGTPETWSFTRPGDRAEYGGWWGCLIPAGASEQLGLAAPYFLKWDDAEYGLRAGAAGYAVAAVPGLAVHHPTWATKGTSSSWSSWPLHRNRLATAAAYGAGRGVLADSLAHQVKHVLSLQYATAELWNAALAEMLDGPAWLDADLTAVRPRAQELLDAAPAAPVVGLPAAAAAHPGPTHPRPGVAAAVRAAAGLVRPPATSGRHAVATLAGPSDFGWADGLGRDAVVFADGAAPLVRDPRRARRALARTLRLHVEVALRWGGLRRAYARALPAASATERWVARFRGSPRA
jgi:galactofuranosylgalactofuranosylrhamnosyl-N-acetylglucosaminyl-diphospho-decaprenol beta-1,5/1,6-galactofuranosyltransferase